MSWDLFEIDALCVAVSLVALPFLLWLLFAKAKTGSANQRLAYAGVTALISTACVITAVVFELIRIFGNSAD